MYLDYFFRIVLEDALLLEAGLFELILILWDYQFVSCLLADTFNLKLLQSQVVSEYVLLEFINIINILSKLNFGLKAKVTQHELGYYKLDK